MAKLRKGDIDLDSITIDGEKLNYADNIKINLEGYKSRIKPLKRELSIKLEVGVNGKPIMRKK